MEEKAEGILLKAIPYLGKQKILKVFTESEGLLSFMAKTNALTSFTSPFLRAEWVYKKGKEEIHLLKDATLLDDFASLRSDYEKITRAGIIAQDLLHSQFPGKKGASLYALTNAYFKKLSSFSDPRLLCLSFRLKLLLHEGLLSLQNRCSLCSAAATHLSEGESVCSNHKGFETSAFSVDEWSALQILTYTKQFSLLEAISLTTSFEEKVNELVTRRLSR